MQNASNKSEKIIFTAPPETYDQLIALPQTKLSTPFETAANIVLMEVTGYAPWKIEERTKL